MTKINLESNIYLYGIYYDTSRVRFPKKEHNWTGIIIYTAPVKNEEYTSLSSIEGLFVTKKNLGDLATNLLCQRIQMKEFEKKHNGKFIPFEK